MSSSSGCSSGSPPEIVTTEVPSAPSLSMRRYISSSGTGFEKSSYSLQYVHARLQRRIGMMCASSGWSVEASAWTAIFAPRRLRCTALARRRKVVRAEGIGCVTSITTQHHRGCRDGNSVRQDCGCKRRKMPTSQNASKITAAIHVRLFAADPRLFQRTLPEPTHSPCHKSKSRKSESCSTKAAQ